MKEKIIYSNKGLFLAYSIANIFLMFFLLTLLILLFNDIFILSRVGFVFFVGIHISLLFFIKIQYLRIAYDEEKQLIEFHYNRRFGLKWQKKSRTVQLPLKQFDGYTLTKDSFGLTNISFFKREKKERYELGPFHIGFISKSEHHLLEETFGNSL